MIKQMNTDVSAVIRQQAEFAQRVKLTQCLLEYYQKNGSKKFTTLFSKEVKDHFNFNNLVNSNAEYLWEFCDTITTYLNYESFIVKGKYLTFSEKFVPGKPYFHFSKEKIYLNLGPGALNWPYCELIK